jgi:hypothetical protein
MAVKQILKLSHRGGCHSRCNLPNRWTEIKLGILYRSSSGSGGKKKGSDIFAGQEVLYKAFLCNHIAIFLFAEDCAIKIIVAPQYCAAGTFPVTQYETIDLFSVFGSS